MMRTTININDNLLKEVKKISLERNCSIGEVIDEAILLSLSNQKGKHNQGEAFRPLITFKGDGLQPGIELNHNASLLEAMES